MIVGIDIGTQSLKAVVLSPEMKIIGEEAIAYQPSFPKAGWAEQDPLLWEEALAPANEQARLAIVTPPEGEATTVVAGVRERWSLFVGSRVEDPELPSRLGVERCDSME